MFDAPAVLQDITQGHIENTCYLVNYIRNSVSLTSVADETGPLYLNFTLLDIERTK